MTINSVTSSLQVPLPLRISRLKMTASVVSLGSPSLQPKVSSSLPTSSRTNRIWLTTLWIWCKTTRKPTHLIRNMLLSKSWVTGTVSVNNGHNSRWCNSLFNSHHKCLWEIHLEAWVPKSQPQAATLDSSHSFSTALCSSKLRITILTASSNNLVKHHSNNGRPRLAAKIPHSNKLNSSSPHLLEPSQIICSQVCSPPSSILEAGNPLCPSNSSLVCRWTWIMEGAVLAVSRVHLQWVQHPNKHLKLSIMAG